MFPWNMMFPFQNKADNSKKMNPEEVQSFISQLFSQVMPENMQQMMNQNQSQGQQQGQAGGFPNLYTSPAQKPAELPLQANVFETHSHIYVRIPIRDQEWLKRIKVYHTSNHSIIEGIPEAGERHTIPLPAPVRKKGAAAQYKDGILEMRLQKSSDYQYSEIDVTGI